MLAVDILDKVEFVHKCPQVLQNLDFTFNVQLCIELPDQCFFALLRATIHHSMIFNNFLLHKFTQLFFGLGVLLPVFFADLRYKEDSIFVL